MEKLDGSMRCNRGQTGMGAGKTKREEEERAARLKQETGRARRAADLKQWARQEVEMWGREWKCSACYRWPAGKTRCRRRPGVRAQERIEFWNHEKLGFRHSEGRRAVGEEPKLASCFWSGSVGEENREEERKGFFFSTKYYRRRGGARCCVFKMERCTGEEEMVRTARDGAPDFWRGSPVAGGGI